MTTRGSITRATFAVSGFSGPDEASRLEKCLTASAGVRRAEVRTDIQAAKIEFDESKVSAQAIAPLIVTGGTAGGGERLVPKLLLKVPSVRNEEKARLPIQVLCKLPSVERVTPQIAVQAVEVEFSLEGDLTTEELISALAVEGIIANVM